MTDLQALLLRMVFALLYLGGYAAAPLLLIWGWVRWTGRPKSWAIWSILSLAGLVVATVSALCAVTLFIYSSRLGGGLEHFDDSVFMGIFRSGKLLSQVAFVFGLAGVWRPSATRWLSPASAMGAVLFWLFTGGD